MEKSLVVSIAADKLPENLNQNDEIYKKVNEINMKKSSPEMKQKHENRSKEIKEIIVKICKSQPEL